MDIAILGTRGIPAAYGGFETFAEELSTRLVARGHRLWVYCRPHGVGLSGAGLQARRSEEIQAPAGVDARPTQYRGVRLVFLPSLRHKYFDTVSHTLLSALHVLFGRTRFDAVLVCNAANSAFAWLPRLRGIPVAINVDGLERKRRKWNALGRAWYRLGEWLATWTPNRIVTDAACIERYYLQEYGRDSRFIPYGGSPPRDTGSDVLEELGLEPGRYVLYVSRLEPENNALLLRRAFERVETEVKLAVVGDAPYAADYIAQVRDTRDPRIVFPGAVYGRGYDQLRAHALLYVHATEVGGTHPALVEAMAAGLPVLYLDTIENREVAGDAGLAFACSQQDLAGKMQFLLSHAAEREALARRASEHARTVYDWEAVTSAYERLFEEMRRGRITTETQKTTETHRGAVNDDFGESPATTDALRPLVSVIVVNWGRRDLLRACLASLRAQSLSDLEVIVVDNGSQDGSAAMVRAEFPEAALIENAENRGFCAANNQGIRAARGRYIALLNNDAEADPRWLESLVAAAQSASGAGMFASKILLYEHRDTIDKIGHLIYPDGQNRGRACGERDTGQYDRVEDALYPDGCAALYDRRVFEIAGLFDEDFFAYGDDAELGLRIRLAGWGCLFVPSAVVHHHHSSTLGRFSEDRIVLVERNRVWLAAKLFPWRLLLLNPFYTAVRFAANALAAARGQGEAGRFAGEQGWWVLTRCLLRAYTQALRGLPAILRKRRDVRAFRRVSDREFLDLLRKFRISARELAFQAAPPKRTAAEQVAAGLGAPASCRHLSVSDDEAGRAGKIPARPACPLCGCAEARARFESSDRLFRTTSKRFRIVQCAGCGGLRLSPMPEGDELASYYPRRYWWSGENEGGAARRLESFYRQGVLRDHARFLRRALGPPPARILDAGCGSGDLLAMIRGDGYSCMGMDFSLPALAAAHRQGIAALLADYHRPPLAPESFDAVSMYHFLEHLPDPGAALAFAHQVLRPGGRLIVQVPNASSWQAALLGARWSGFDVPRHLVDFRRADIEELVEKAGFRVRRRKHFSWRDNPAALATSLAPGLEPVSRRVRLSENTPRRLALDLAYFALVVASLPLALVEAAAGRGATIMLEAVKQ